MSPASRTEVQAALRYALSVATDPLDVFRDLDPLDVEFCPALVAGLQNCARGLWRVLVREFPETPAWRVLRARARERGVRRTRGGRQHDHLR